MPSRNRVVSTQTTHQAFPFLHLPKILRIQVYDNLLVDPRPINPIQNRTIQRYFKPVKVQSVLWRTGLALLGSCRQVKNECSQILYGDNAFDFRPNRIEEILKFFGNIGKENLSRIRSMSINFEYSQEQNCFLFRDLVRHNVSLPYSGVDGKEDFEKRVKLPFSEKEKIEAFESLNPKNLSLYTSKLSKLNLSEIKEHISRYEMDFDLDWLSWIHISIQQRLSRNKANDLTVWYPNWEYWHSWKGRGHNFAEESRDAIFSTLEILKTCSALESLKIILPDPQRFMAGWLCFRKDRLFLRPLQELTSLKEVTFHGIDELTAITCVIEKMKIPMVVAKLNQSKMNPRVHVESGRPNLRAYVNWAVTTSTETELTLVAKPTKRNDPFSRLPTELRSEIYDYVFENWRRRHWPDPNIDYDDIDCYAGIERPNIMTRAHQNGGWEKKPKCNSAPCILPKNFVPLRDLGHERAKTHFMGIAGTSRKIHGETTFRLYEHSQFAARGYRTSFMPQKDGIDIGCNVHFLRQIGDKNRFFVRHLAMEFGLYGTYDPGCYKNHCSVWHHHYYDSPERQFEFWEEPGLNRPLSAVEEPDTRVCCVEIKRWEMEENMRKLLSLVEDIPFLETLSLDFRPLECDDCPHTLDFYLERFSRLRNVKSLWMTGDIEPARAEWLARTMGAGSVVLHVWERERKKRKVDGWIHERYCRLKVLNKDNLTPEVARRLYGSKEREVDQAVLLDNVDLFDDELVDSENG